MLKTLMIHSILSLATAAPSPLTVDPVAVTVSSELRSRVAATYAAHVHAEYGASREAAEVMRAAINAFCAAPSEPGLARARETWIAARRIYGRTEVFRFGNGPIDTTRGGVETLVNAWPVDEAFIDQVPGAAAPGIIANPARYPSVRAVVLRELNQHGGETNVCTGWHAIEFLLWGQDRSETGPGDRPATDFVDGAAPFADRRREFLLEITDMLVDDLRHLERSWRPAAEDNHRARFTADPSAALESMLSGIALLTGFEMSGERLAVAYETRDEEDEHSCFSDTTHFDFIANIEGVASVIRGRGGPGILAVARAHDATAAAALEADLDAAVQAVRALPVPFDAAIRAADGTPERARLLAAIEALEQLSVRVSAVARELGYYLPTEPQG